MFVKNALTIKFTGIIASILFVFSVFVYEFSSSFRENEFNERLNLHTHNLVKTILDSNDVSLDLIKTSFKHQLNIFPNQTLVIYNNKNQVFFQVNSIDNEMDIFLKNKLKDEPAFSFSKNDKVYIGFKYNFGNHIYTVITSAIDKDGVLKLVVLKWSLVLLFIICLGISIFLGRFFAKQALMPINKVIGQVEKVTEANLSQRVEVGTGVDEVVQLAQTFNQMLDRLENSFKLQKTFVSNASHEFRTPLTVMKGQIEVLLLQPRSTETYIRTFSSLLDDINNQIDLINGLGNLASANANFPNINFARVNIIDLLDECASELARNKKYKAVLNIEEIPDNEETWHMLGNHALLRSALMNVMDNACKFSKIPTCQVNLSCTEGYIFINVIDQGVGIGKEDLEHVFESFYRSNNIRHIQGHGIGLSLVKKIIDLHHGKIAVTSELGKGTIMTIYLPNYSSKNKLA